ncbi:hypothetical protein BGZ88_002009 [Linnemannia elongata]|nr:hypothetical protein BGZ88_002009 [Linnemannia elongata]
MSNSTSNSYTNNLMRKAFEFIKESYPYQVAAYSDSIVGVTIIPRITGSEAKLQYGLDGSILELLPHVTARFVSSTGEICKIKMYEEREILERARWMFGGSVGVLNARRVLAILGERIEHPPCGSYPREKKLYSSDVLEARPLCGARTAVRQAIC